MADEEGWVMLVMLMMLSERGGWERTDDSRWHVVALATLSFEAYWDAIVPPLNVLPLLSINTGVRQQDRKVRQSSSLVLFL